MARMYSSLSSLDKAIRKAILSALKNEVANAVEETTKQHIQSDVYAVYDPVEYQRRGELKNAAFQHDIYYVGSDIAMRSFSTAKQNRSVIGSSKSYPVGAFAQWIQDGAVPNIFNKRHYICQDARPFYTNSVQELESRGLVREALAQGLKRRGVKTV